MSKGNSTDRPQYLRCRAGVVIPGPVVFRPGDLIKATDPRLARYPGLARYFDPVTSEAVETATRAPGEVRITPPRRRRREVDQGGTG